MTHVSLGAGAPDVSAHIQAPDEAIALGRVDSGGEGQRGSVLAGRKLHLSQIVDEEVEFARVRLCAAQSVSLL